MKIDITIRYGESSYDISVENGQKISSTFKILSESIKAFPKMSEEMHLYKSDDNQMLDFDKTYEEQSVFQGHILEYRKDKKIESLLDDDKDSISYKECKAETYKIADFALKNNNDFAKLTSKRVGLLDCISKLGEEDITFYYDVFEKHSLVNIKSSDYISKYRFLINFPNIFEANDYYSYKYEDNNIYYDDNMLPYIKKRTLKYNTNDNKVEYDTLKVYKAMIYYVLSSRQTFVEGLEAGELIFLKEKSIAAYMELESVAEIRELLKTNLEKYINKENKHKKKVNKAWNFIKNVLLILMVLIVGFATYEVYTWNTALTKDNHIIAGNKAFIKKDYFSCIAALNTVSVDDMDYDTKYILASAYARTENMNREELQNIVDRITFTSSEKELEYWIYLGRGEYAMAEDTAKVVMSDQLLVYAYMKELDYLQLSTDISGAEKSSRIQELQSAIKELGEKYSTDTEEEQPK